MNWYRAELDGKEGLIPSNYIEMKSHEWVDSINKKKSLIQHWRHSPLITVGITVA